MADAHSMDFLRTLPKNIRQSVYSAVMAALKRGNYAPGDISRVRRRYDEESQKTEVRISFHNADPAYGDLILSLPGRH